MYVRKAARWAGSSGRVSRKTTTSYLERKSAFSFRQSDVVSKLKSYFAAIRGNQRSASWTKLMCAWSCLPVKNAITLNPGLRLLPPRAELQKMSAAALHALRAALLTMVRILDSLLALH